MTTKSSFARVMATFILRTSAKYLGMNEYEHNQTAPFFFYKSIQLLARILLQKSWAWSNTGNDHYSTFTTLVILKVRKMLDRQNYVSGNRRLSCQHQWRATFLSQALTKLPGRNNNVSWTKRWRRRPRFRKHGHDCFHHAINPYQVARWMPWANLKCGKEKETLLRPQLRPCVPVILNICCEWEKMTKSTNFD